MAAKLSELDKTYHQFKEAEDAYQSATGASLNRDRDMEYSQYVVDEIHAARLIVGEDDELEALSSDSISLS